MRRALIIAAGLLGDASALAAQAPGRSPFNVDSIAGPTRLLEFTATEGTWTGVDVSPDGQRIAFDLLGHIYEMPIGGGDAVALTRGRSYNHLPRYSPDGKTILFTSDRSGKEEIWLLHRGADSVEKVSRFDNRAFAGSWSRDGRSIYASTMDLGARFAAHRIDRHGSRLQLVSNGVFGAATHFSESATGRKAYFAEPAGAIYQTGFRIRTYDLETGEVATYLERPGGAADPLVSPDGKWLAYVHRDNLRTVLVLHDLATQQERILIPGLDRDRQESGAGTTFGIYPNYSWTPDSRRIVIAYGGKVHAVAVTDGSAREIPYRAQVRRVIAETIRFPVEIADGKAKTRSHGWIQRTDQGIISAALGDIYLSNGATRANLTSSRALETSPTYDPATKTLYYASWSDDSLGAVWSLPLGTARRSPTRLTRAPAQYGSLTLSADGRTLAYLRGPASISRGQSIEDQTEFDLILVGPDRAERQVTSVAWRASNPLAVRTSPAIRFSPDGSTIYFNEFERDTLFLRRVGTDGKDERTLLVFPHGARASVSPDLQWVAFREYFRTWLTPLTFAGKPVTVSAIDKQGTAIRVDSTGDGEYLEWTPDSRSLYWSRGTTLRERSLADVLAGKGSATTTDLAFEYDVAAPAGVVALTNARVITSDPQSRVLEGATVIVRGNKIESIGAGGPVPAGARVFDLSGKTIMPGMIDAHGHYNPDGSTLNVIEQNHVGLVANLAYGTTTVYEVYGNHLKDAAVSDLQRSGGITGSRLLSTGPPIYGLRYYRPKSYRPILSQADADEIVSFNKSFGATALKDYVQFNRSARMQLYDAARRMGVNVVAETAVDFQMNWTMLMDGVSGLEHTVGLTPIYSDVLKLWSATKAGNTPTLIVSYNGPAGETAFHQAERLWDDPKLLTFFPKDDLLRFRRPTRFFDDDVYAVELAREMKKIAQAGISVHISGHGQMHGLDKHWEMELLSRGGFTPAEIIATATINSARYLGLDRQLGSIEPGKLADLVILDANPLDDIRNSRKIDMVMQNGVLYRGADASRLHPNPEPAGKQYRFHGSATGAAAIDRH